MLKMRITCDVMAWPGGAQPSSSHTAHLKWIKEQNVFSVVRWLTIAPKLRCTYIDIEWAGEEVDI